MQIPTIKIRQKDGSAAIINADDFDPASMQLWQDAPPQSEPKPTPKRRGRPRKRDANE